MELYHGSSVYFENIDLSYAKPFKDFGEGFYVTSIRSQAEVWATRFGKGYVYCFECDLNKCQKELHTKEFLVYNVEWLDFVMQCRKYNRWTRYDLIYDRMADGRITNLVEEYYRKEKTAQEVLREIRFTKPANQYCFKTEEAIKKLKLLRIDECKPEDKQ